jgi:hypothetical protein
MNDTDMSVDLKFMRQLTEVTFEKAKTGNQDALDTIKKVAGSIKDA